MISPMLVILAANSEAFAKDSRAADDIRAELDAKCLEEFPTARLAVVPYCTVKQNVTDKKLPAHEAAAGKQPKMRRISDKAAGSSALAACNAWVVMEKRAKLELCRLDDILNNIVAMCVMCVAWNRAETCAGRPGAFGVYLTSGDVDRAYTAQIHKNIRHVIDALRNTPRNRRRVSKNAFRAYILAKNGAYI